MSVHAEFDSLHPLSGLHKVLLFAAPFAILAVIYGGPLAVQSYRQRTTPPQVAVADNVSGARVYATNCAYCHGINGDGRGSVVLQPPARYFGRDRFKFASTANGMPTDDDLKGIIARGIPGSAMPSFATLSSAEVDALIPYLRRFITAGLYDRQVQKALKDDEDPEPAKFARVAAEASIPGEVLAVPASFPAATAESIARGKALFLSEAWGCSKCHGVEGRGDGPQVKDPAFKNDDGTPAVPRDLTKGVYKGGGDPQQLYRRIRLGIPGTPMPDSKDKPEAQVVDVIHYLRSLYQGPPVTAPPAGQ